MHTYSTRKSALAAGAPRYFNAVPCKYGHNEGRYTAGGSCVVCANARQRAAIKRPITADKKAQYLGKWNASTKGYQAKLRWKEKDPKNAWACSAMGGARVRAKKYGVPLDIDKAYVRSILTDTCPVFGTPFVWHGNKLSAYSPSLDRIHPALGYVRGNVVIIAQRANAIKSDATTAEIAQVLGWLQQLTKV